MEQLKLGMCVGLAVAALCQVGQAEDADELKMLAHHAAMQEMADRIGERDPGGSAFEVGCIERDGVMSCRGFSDCQCEALGGFFEEASGVCAVDTETSCASGIQGIAPRLRGRTERDDATQINTSCAESPLDYCCELTLDGRVVCKGFTTETCTAADGAFDRFNGECAVEVAIGAADDLQMREDPERPDLDIINPNVGVAELSCHVNAWSWLVCVGDYLPVCPNNWEHHADNTCCYRLD